MCTEAPMIHFSKAWIFPFLYWLNMCNIKCRSERNTTKFKSGGSNTQMSCYLASSTHTHINHLSNESLTRVIALANTSHVSPTRANTSHPTPASYVRTRTCGTMRYTHVYPCQMCIFHHTHSHIYIFYHRVHVDNSHISTLSWVKWLWLRLAQGKVFAWLSLREWSSLLYGYYPKTFTNLNLLPYSTINNLSNAQLEWYKQR